MDPAIQVIKDTIFDTKTNVTFNDLGLKLKTTLYKIILFFQLE